MLLAVNDMQNFSIDGCVLVVHLNLRKHHDQSEYA